MGAKQAMRLLDEDEMSAILVFRVGMFDLADQLGQEKPLTSAMLEESPSAPISITVGRRSISPRNAPLLPLAFRMNPSLRAIALTRMELAPRIFPVVSADPA
jgi:hypothetical protein